MTDRKDSEPFAVGKAEFYKLDGDHQVLLLTADRDVIRDFLVSEDQKTLFITGIMYHWHFDDNVAAVRIEPINTRSLLSVEELLGGVQVIGWDETQEHLAD